MKIFVTGLGGFVGHHLQQRLARRHAVSGFSISDCDIRNAAQVRNLITTAQPEWLIHLAGQAFVPRSWDNPQETLDVNVLGTLHVLDAAREVPGVRVLLISTVEVYGEPAGRVTEKSPTFPQSPYATSKLAAECLARNYAVRHGVDVVIARPTNHIGPGQSPQFAVSDWARQLARGATVLRVGNLDPYRDFTDVRDVAHAYELALRHGKTGEIYNITSQRVVKMREVLETLIAVHRRPVRVEVDREKFRASTGAKCQFDSRKFRRVTGWRPQVSLRKTLRDVLEYWRSCAS